MCVWLLIQYGAGNCKKSINQSRRRTLTLTWRLKCTFGAYLGCFFFLLNFSLVVVFEFPFTPICYPSVWNFQEVFWSFHSSRMFWLFYIFKFIRSLDSNLLFRYWISYWCRDPGILTNWRIHYLWKLSDEELKKKWKISVGHKRSLRRLWKR